MKKLIFLTFILFACQKESCYTCNLTYTTTTSGGGTASDSHTSKATVNKCNMSQKEIDAFIRESTTSATATIGGVTATTRSSCTCIKD